MISTNKSNNNSQCPVCKTELSLSSNNIQHCSKCRREYYSVVDDQQNKNKLEYDDIEPVSNDNEGPILLSEKPKEPKEDSYLRRHFGSSVTIETEIEIPTE